MVLHRLMQLLLHLLRQLVLDRGENVLKVRKGERGLFHGRQQGFQSIIRLVARRPIAIETGDQAPQTLSRTLLHVARRVRQQTRQRKGKTRKWMGMRCIIELEGSHDLASLHNGSGRPCETGDDATFLCPEREVHLHDLHLREHIATRYVIAHPHKKPHQFSPTFRPQCSGVPLPCEQTRHTVQR